jgi:hypothetical protein
MSTLAEVVSAGMDDERALIQVSMYSISRRTSLVLRQ